MNLPRTLQAGLAGVLVTGASCVTALLALELADGVTHLHGSSYETEFVQDNILYLAWLLPLGVGVTAYLDWKWAPLALLGLVTPQVYMARETVARYTESGWGDGLEIFIYVVPIGLAMLGLIAGVTGWAVGRGHQPSVH